MQVLVTISSAGTKINVEEMMKNWSIKVYICDKGFIWNPSNCKCECDKSCDIGEYLDYWNCKCREKLVDKLTEECTENIDEVEITGITQYILYYFQYSLQLTLKLVLTLLTTNT